MSTFQQILLPLSVLLRVGAAVSGLILLFGTIWFVQTAFSSISGVIEFGAGLLTIILALMPLRSCRVRAWALVWVAVCTLALLNVGIGAYSIFAKAYPLSSIMFGAVNALSVWLLLLVAHMSNAKDY